MTPEQFTSLIVELKNIEIICGLGFAGTMIWIMILNSKPK